MSAVEQHSRLILWSSIGVLTVSIVWAALAEVDQVTRAQGKVIASSRSQIIQSAEGGGAGKIACARRVYRGERRTACRT